MATQALLALTGRRGSVSGWTVIAGATALLLLCETGAQLRSQLKTGNSIFSRLYGERTFVTDPQTGLKTYRPNAVIAGSEGIIRTNRYGLRSPDIQPLPEPGELRLAILGASTVAGAATPSNEQSFSQRLARLLADSQPRRRVNVINAGIPGYRLEHMRQMLERRIAPLRPSSVLLYTGFNDITPFCRAGGKRAPVAAWYPTLPNSLFADLVKKNSVFLRGMPVRSRPAKSDALNGQAIAEYRVELERMADVARRNRIELIIVSSLKSYRREMPVALQEQLTATARYYNGCFDIEGLHSMTERLNDVQMDVARSRGLRFIDLRDKVPGGSRYFADANHLTVEGERLVARSLFAALNSH
jgi:lysophospholipase L1-like esterase